MFELCEPLFYINYIIFLFENLLQLCLDFLWSSQYLDHELGFELLLHLPLLSSLSNYYYRVPPFSSSNFLFHFSLLEMKMTYQTHSRRDCCTSNSMNHIIQTNPCCYPSDSPVLILYASLLILSTSSKYMNEESLPNAPPS